ncbi:hypothetical protein E3J51_05785 [Candidatus Bathyarchaeota archaeon]|nr:MAG: hypothetical protein E3J51_05785 [Candidatus Bathyarchaeota archaeon]
MKDKRSLPKLSVLNLIGAVYTKAVRENVTVTPHNGALNNAGIVNSKWCSRFSITHKVMGGTRR